MSTPRAIRGADRARNTRGGTAATRGMNGRGRGHSGLAHNTNERPAQGVYTRGGRGSTSTRGTAQARGRHGHPNPFSTSPTPGALNTTPHAPGAYKQRLDHIKAERPSLRAQFVRDGLMNPEGQMRLSDSVKLYGICADMCPEFERVRRIVEEDVKAPECTLETEHLPRKQRIPDESRMVKAYSRSAAGAKQELVSDIRSPATCLKTINYLYERLDHDDFDFLHQWLWDRTRAIRKDLRTQRIESKPDINILLTCLERSARFLLLSTHHMARSTKEDYTHQQDIEQLNQTLMSLKERYVDNRRASIPSENEAEFWAYRLILAPIYTNTQLENELHRVPSDLRNNSRVKVAIEIFRALKSVIITRSKAVIQTQSNWKRFWDLIKSPRVSYLMACAAEISFNRMRHVVLDSIWRSYRQGTSRQPRSVDGWTPSRLREVLGLDSDSEAVKHCEAYGFVFVRADAGHTYMDFTQKGYQNHVLGMPSTDAELKPQIFSESIVEVKRYNRALSAVIQGMPVEQARSRGLALEGETDIQVEQEMEDETSLFVPETSALRPVATPANVLQAANTHASNPFAFAQTSSNPLPAPAPGPAANGGSFQSMPTAISPAPTNPFLNNAGAFSTPAVNPFASFHTRKTGGSAPSLTSEIKPTFTSAGFIFEKDKVQNTPQTQASLTPTGSPPEVNLTTQAETIPQVIASQADTNNREAAEKAQRDEEIQRKRAEAREAVQNAMRQKRAREEAEQQRKQAEAAIQQQQRDEQERRIAEERAKTIQEIQNRQALEEQTRILQLKEKEATLHSLTMDVMFHPAEGLMMQFIECTALTVAHEALTEVRQEKNEEVGEEMYKQYQLRLKRAGMAKIIAYLQKKRKTEQARARRKRLRAQRAQIQMQEEVTVNDYRGQVPKQSPKESLSQQSTQAHNLRRIKRTNKQRGSHQQNDVNGALWLNTSQQNGVNGSNTSPKDSSLGPASQNTAALVNHRSEPSKTYSKAYQRSTAPIDRTETDWFALRAMGIDPSRHRKRSFDSTSSGEGDEPQIGLKRAKFSPEQQLDMSTPQQQQQQQQQQQHLQHEQQLNGQQQLHKPHPRITTTIDEQRAHLRALQEKFRKSTSEARIDSARSVNGRSSFGGSIKERSTRDRRTSDIIARARKLVASSVAVSPVLPVNGDVAHDFGRSVPNLGISAIGCGAAPSLRASVAVTDRPNAPAYWQRTSRFVPRECYGKGPEAIREYRAKWGLSPAASIGGGTPRSWSQPEPQPYRPQSSVSEAHQSSHHSGLGFGFTPQNNQTGLAEHTDAHGGFTNDESAGVDFVGLDVSRETDLSDGDGDSELYDKDEGDEEESDDGEEDDDEEREEDEEEELQDYTQYTSSSNEDEEEVEDEEEEDSHQYAQPRMPMYAGGTQDDAIELSD